MSRPIPDLEIPNTTGACWTCINRFGDHPNTEAEACDKRLPACTACVASGRICEGYHARLKWPRSSHRPPARAQPALYSTVSSLGLPSNENRLLQHYLRNFSRISVAIDYDGNGWRRILGVGLNESALQNALLAISEAHLTRLQRKSVSQSHKYVQKSLQSLQSRFEDPALLRNEITLMTLLALLVHELCEGTEKWKQHYGGIVAWFRSRDDLTDVDPFLTTYISMIATQVVLSSRGDERRQSYLLLEKLLPSWDSQNAVEVVFGGSVAIPRLIVEAARLGDDLIAARALSDQDQIEEIFIRAEELQSRIKNTQILSPSQPRLSLLGSPKASGPNEQALFPIIPSESFGIYEAARCSAEICRYALHVFVHRIIYDPLSTSGQSPLVQEAVTESLRMLPTIPDTEGPGTFLGWALVVIGAETDNLDQREFIRRRLESLTLLSVNHGILALKVLDVVWSRRDDLSLGKSLNRRVRWQDVMEDLEVDQALV
ncbi:fungal-specific transcription factor domain-containing protein [Hypoxylon rubiginosum]|uniref:Fungal-specific transcription factor domain-containing protein n=1 Tax=Hypoxylon rubiginosum TaxID=110542 RepID=A0ACC0CSC2_9PEZI|nr:fungal-specific transcription factor domain-containing protein [Hypoxylon rubiginosum]